MKFDFSGKTSDLPRVPNYLGGRDRRNLTFWVLGGGFLLLIASNFSAFSKFAKAILPSRGSAVDTRVPLEAYREPLPYEAVQMLPFDENTTVESALAKQAGEKPEAADPSAPAKEDSAPSPAVEMPPPLPKEPPPKMPAHGKYYSAVNVPLLATVQNEAPFRQSENDAWFHLMDVVNKALPEQLKKEATPIYDFATLFGQSNFYRGQAISITGVALRYTEFKSNPPDNAAGIPKYYQIAFQINPREDNPIMAYVINLPADMPRGTPDPTDPDRFILKPGVPFSCEGIFFKNFAHAAGDGEFRLYPALIAKTIRLQPVHAAAPPTNPMVYLMALLCVGMLFFVVMYFLAAKRKKIEFTIPTPTGSEAFSGIAAADIHPEAKDAWPDLPDVNNEAK